MILNHNLNPDLKWNANERFQFLKIGVVFMKMDLEVYRFQPQVENVYYV